MANKIKNLTINDLDKQSFIEYKTQVYKKIEPILLKHFSTKELQCLGKQNYFWKCMFGEKKFCRYDGKTFDSIIRYSTRKQTIPLDFDCVMTVVLEKDLTTTGIFRISTNYVQLDQVEKEMFRLISMNVIRDDILDFLRNYDIVMLTTLFSRLFSHYKTSLFPNGLLDIAMKAVTIPDEQEKFKIFKMILLAFPHTKRTMLESVGKFIKTVSDTNINADKSKSRSMTLNGICKVLAPRMFLSCNQKIQIQDLFVYIEILDYIFGNMPTIIELENILNTRHKSFKFK